MILRACKKNIFLLLKYKIMVDVILGLQWGDEGKGKIVDYFAPNYDVIARFQGGPNAGHTLYVNGTKMVLHQIPSGIFHQDKINIIGNGVVLDPVTLKKDRKKSTLKVINSTVLVPAWQVNCAIRWWRLAVP